MEGNEAHRIVAVHFWCLMRLMLYFSRFCRVRSQLIHLIRTLIHKLLLSPLTVSRRYTLMNFSASKQWIKGIRNQVNGTLSVLHKLVHSHYKGASIMYSNQSPSSSFYLSKLFSRLQGLLRRVKLVLKYSKSCLSISLKSISKQAVCFVSLFSPPRRLRWSRKLFNSIILLFAVLFFFLISVASSHKWP